MRALGAALALEDVLVLVAVPAVFVVEKLVLSVLHTLALLVVHMRAGLQIELALLLLVLQLS